MILAIDPGRQKCGLAVLGPTGWVLHKAVVERAKISGEVQPLLLEYQLTMIVIGQSAFGRRVKAELMKIYPDLNMVFVSEKNSTWQARQRYWQANPPQGWLRFIPVSLRVPPEPVDDLAAVIIGERYLQQFRV